MLISGWERIGVGDSCEVGGLISGGDDCRFLVKNCMVGRDFAFLMMLRIADIGLILNYWFGLVLIRNEKCQRIIKIGKSRETGKNQMIRKADHQPNVI